MERALNDHAAQSRIKRVFRVGPVKPVISIGSAHDQLRGLKFPQFILHRLQGEEAQTSQFSHKQFLPRISKQEPKNLRAHYRKQCVQKRLSHEQSYVRPLKAVKIRTGPRA
jgi:hypothetical protein